MMRGRKRVGMWERGCGRERERERHVEIDVCVGDSLTYTSDCYAKARMLIHKYVYVYMLIHKYMCVYTYMSVYI